MSEERIPITIRLTKTVHEAMKRYKSLTGMSINSQVYASVAVWLFQKELLSLEDIDKNYKKYKNNKKKTVTQPLPEGVKYCDGDSCEITPS